jgi:ParB-like chromosome segregation protein Spo0J
VQLIDGERRLRACTMAGVPFRAEVREGAAAGADVEELFATSFAANFGKQNHDAIEIAQEPQDRQAADELSRGPTNDAAG